MSAVARVNQDGRDHGVQYSVANLKCMELDAGATLASKDGIDGFIALVMGEMQPLLYKSTSTNGKIFMIVDGHSVTAASLQARYQNMGTVDGINVSALTVVERDIDAFDAA